MKELEAAGWRKAVEKKKDEITELDIKESRIRELSQNFTDELRETVEILLRSSCQPGKLTNVEGPRQIFEKDSSSKTDIFLKM
jgi:hypothetical protein